LLPKVLNESHGKQEDESHFKAIIVSEAFAGKVLGGAVCVFA
jgi:stress-induced morphogen